MSRKAFKICRVSSLFNLCTKPHHRSLYSRLFFSILNETNQTSHSWSSFSDSNDNKKKTRLFSSPVNTIIRIHEHRPYILCFYSPTTNSNSLSDFEHSDNLFLSKLRLPNHRDFNRIFYKTSSWVGAGLLLFF